MDENTSFIGALGVHYECVDSTHETAKLLIQSGRPANGFVLTADYQHDGKGQFDRPWKSNPGSNLLCSIILYPTFIRANELFKLHLMASLAVGNMLESFGIGNYQVKWPNDIVVDRRKIAGILIHNVIKGQHIDACVLSIGLNINQDDFGSLNDRATSMAVCKGDSFEKEIVKKQLFRQLNYAYMHIQRVPIQMKKAYLNRLLGFNETTTFEGGKQGSFEGRLIDVELDGSVQIDIGGEQQSFQLNEVKLSKAYG